LQFHGQAAPLSALTFYSLFYAQRFKIRASFDIIQEIKNKFGFKAGFILFSRAKARFNNFYLKSESGVDI